jgi:hypothetical protein
MGKGGVLETDDGKPADEVAGEEEDDNEGDTQEELRGVEESDDRGCDRGGIGRDEGEKREEEGRGGRRMAAAGDAEGDEEEMWARD